jgi:hypothetical protein
MHLLHELFTVDEHPLVQADAVRSGGASLRACSDGFFSRFACLSQYTPYSALRKADDIVPTRPPAAVSETRNSLSGIY